jgi:hypothetical protein
LTDFLKKVWTNQRFSKKSPHRPTEFTKNPGRSKTEPNQKHMKSYIPAADSNASLWMLNFAAVIAASLATYGVDAGTSAQITALSGTFETALQTATDPATRTTATIAAKDSARAAAEAYIRPIAVRISIDPAITPSDKAAAGVTVRADGPTPVPAPVVAPQLGLRSIIPGQATIEATNPTNGTKAKPDGVVAISLAAVVGTAFTADPSSAVPVGRYSRGIMTPSFQPAQSGLKASLFARYETRTGPGGAAQYGPWSAPLQFHLA